VPALCRARWIHSRHCPAVARARDRNIPPPATFSRQLYRWEKTMGGLIYLIGLIVVIMFILSLLGLR
jgi:hypothetical protein